MNTTGPLTGGDATLTGAFEGQSSSQALARLLSSISRDGQPTTPEQPPPSADSTPSQKALLYTKLNPTHLLRPWLGSTSGVCLGLSLRFRGCPPLPGYLQISKEDQELPWVPTGPSRQISVNQSSCPDSELCTICSHLSHCSFLHKVSSPLTS